MASVPTDKSPFDAFGFHSASAVDNKIVMFGGQNDEGLLNTLRLYDTVTGEWEEPPTSGDVPTARALHSSVVTGTELMLWAGYDGETPFEDFWSLDLTSWKWSQPQLSGTAPSPREGHTATLIDSEIVFFGGADGNQWFNDLHLLDKDQLSWSRPRARGIAPKPREGHTATAYGENKIIVFGGTNGEECFNEVHEFDTSELMWNTLKTQGAPPAPRVFHTATLMAQNQLYIFAGHNGEDRFNDLFRLDLKALSWHTVPASGFAPTPRLCHSSTSFPGSSKTWVVGGYDGSDLHKTVDVLETDLDASSSQRQPAAAAAAAKPSAQPVAVEGKPAKATEVKGKEPAEARTSLVSVWSDMYANDAVTSKPALAFHTSTQVQGDRMVVFGGQSSGEFSDQTHVWDGKSWSTPELSVRPSARAMHSAVKLSDSGDLSSSVLLFGGYDGETAHADLWSLKTEGSFEWTDLDHRTSGSRPSPRQGHCSVVANLDGVETVLTFGGSDGERWFRELYALQYKEGKMVWSSPSVLGTAPTAREGHACAMVADNMYLHGGTAAGETVGDLFMLDLKSLVWIRPEAVGPVPSPRSFHAMVSIGASLMMIGGYNGSLVEPDIFKLETAKQEWSVLATGASSTVSPMQLFCHTATPWGTDSVLVLGGFDGEEHLNSFSHIQMSGSVQHPGTESEESAGHALEAAAARQAAAALDTAAAKAEQAAKEKADKRTVEDKQGEISQKEQVRETQSKDEAKQKEEEAQQREKDEAKQKELETRQKEEAEARQREEEVREQDNKRAQKEIETKQVAEVEDKNQVKEVQEKEALKRQKEEEKARLTAESEANIELFKKREEAATQTQAAKENAAKEREGELREKQQLAQQQQPEQGQPQHHSELESGRRNAVTEEPNRRCDNDERLSRLEDRLASLEGLLHKVLGKLS